MPYCPKCGAEVGNEMRYCPKCGTAVKPEAVSREAYEKHEKGEKEEKHEKGEKAEKHEKSGTSLFWALFGGLMLIVIGGISIITLFLDVPDPWRGAFFLVVIGLVIVVLAIYGAAKASRRSPRP